MRSTHHALCQGGLPPARHKRVPLASSVAGRSCRRRGTSSCRWHAVLGRSCRFRGIDTCRSHPVWLVGAAAGEASAYAACIHGCWQELPSARHQQLLLASIVAGRSCRRRGLSACRKHCCWQELPPASLQELPPARPQRMPLACIVVGRNGRLRGLSACRLHPLLLAGVAACELQADAPCIHCWWQELPPVKPQHMLLACIVACRSCRRRGTSASRLHPLLLAGAAASEAPAHAACRDAAGRSCRQRGTNACRLPPLLMAGAADGEASAHVSCMHCCWQGLPPAKHRRMPLASIVAGRSGHRQGLSASRLHALLLAGVASRAASARAVCIHRCWQEKLPCARRYRCSRDARPEFGQHRYRACRAGPSGRGGRLTATTGKGGRSTARDGPDRGRGGPPGKGGPAPGRVGRSP